MECLDDSPTNNGGFASYTAEFTVPPDDPLQLRAELISPPTATSNVRISYSFPKSAGALTLTVDQPPNGGMPLFTFRPVLYTDKVDVLLPPGTHVVEAWACGGGTSKLRKTIVVPAASQNSSLRGILLTDVLPVYERKSVAGGVSVKVPLGGRFALAVLDGDTLAASPVSSTRTRLDSVVTKPLATRKLFEDDAVAAIGGVTGTDHEFVATHLGTSTWKFKPPSGADVSVTVSVVPPARLGSTENAWDSRVIDVAHKTGILPQFIKGQMAQESPNGKNFNPLAYRYEPCGADLNYISSNLTPEAGGPKVGKTPYVFYRAPNPRGADLSTEDLSPRNRYWLGAPTDANRRHLENSDVDITARQIWDGNNISSKSGPPKGQKWGPLCRPTTLTAINEPGSTILDFVAQTPTAASYGLFQMMYDTAVDEWKGALVDGTRIRAPRYLFDTDENIAIEGGTITIANLFMAKHFIKKQPEALGSYAEFEGWARAAYKLYNSKHPTYPGGVIAHSYDFLPVSASGMFQ